MKNKNYSIRLTEQMADFLVAKSKEMHMFPSEYLRYLVQREMDRERECKKNSDQGIEQK